MNISAIPMLFMLILFNICRQCQSSATSLLRRSSHLPIASFDTPATGTQWISYSGPVLLPEEILRVVRRSLFFLPGEDRAVLSSELHFERPL